MENDDSDLGIVAHSELCGHPPVTTQLHEDEIIRREVESLREELTYDSGTSWYCFFV